MAGQVTTEFEGRDPWCFMRIVDGQVAVLHVRGDAADPTRYLETLEGMRRNLSTGLRKHREDQLEWLDSSSGPQQGPDHRHVLQFTVEQLVEAESARPLRQRRWFPTQADGRDPSGEVHASVMGDEVVVLEAPPDALAEKVAFATAVRHALNLALERLASDVGNRIGRIPPSEPEQPDWAGLAAKVDRIRRLGG